MGVELKIPAYQTPEEQKMRGQLLLIRVVLGLSPIHDPVEAVRVLYEQGREAFEQLRGPAREPF
jgi:hypothetical protein